MRKEILKLLVGCTLLLAPFVVINGAQAESPAIEDTSAVGELAYWNKVKSSEDPAALKLYLDTFPQGMFYDLAFSKYLAAGGSPSKLDTPTAATPPIVEEAVEVPEVVAIEEDAPAPKAYVPKVKVKKAFFKPKSDYRKIQKVRYAIQKRKAKRFEPVVEYKRPVYRKRVAVYKPAKRIACAGTWRNGRCIIKPKYERVKYVKPKYQAPPKPKKVYDSYEDSQGSSGGGGGGGSGGGGWNN